MFQIYHKCLQSVKQRTAIHIPRRFNHYDILNLPRNCTAKEIKASFIRLSKKYHPDRTTNKSSHAKFVKIVEAYNTLIKPETRSSYDYSLTSHSLRSSRTNSSNNYEEQYYENYRPSYDPWSDPLFYHNRKQKQEEYARADPYYGIHGVAKVSNNLIVFICVVLTLLGVSLQAFAIRHSVTMSRQRMIQISNEAEENLKTLQKQVDKNGNELQLEIVKERFRLQKEAAKR